MGSNSAGLTTSLRSLVTALQTNQATLSHLSDNISNVSTIGYNKRVVSQETQVSAGAGVGVNITQVRRSIDEFLLKSVRTQLSKVGEASVISDYMNRLQDFTFGDPSSKFTINNSMSEFYSRLEIFSNNPSSAVNRNMTINSARDFTNGINELATAIQNERLNADSELASSIADLNNILNNLGDINGALRESAAVGGDKNTLEDARDVQIAKLKTYIAADLNFDQFGQVSVGISSTELLGFAQKYRMEYTRASSVGTFVNNSPLGAITVTPIDDNGDPAGRAQTILSASNATEKVDTVPGGKLRGLIDIRDVKLPAILRQLDTFAFTYADAFNEVHNSGTGFPPVTSFTGTESFTLADSREFTGSTRIAVLDDNGQPVLGRFGETLNPLTIDFSRFHGENGFGSASVQNIIDEINRYYNVQPANVANIGSASDIRVGAVSSAVASVKANGSINFSGQPSDGNTLVINGTTITFRNTPTLPNEVQIGTGLGGTLINLAAFLNSSNDSNISLANYSMTGTAISVQFAKSGVTGNTFTLNAAGTPVATASGATLAGGANASGNFTFDFDFANLAPDGTDIVFDVTQLSVNGGPFNPATFNPYTQTAGNRLRTDQENTTNDNLSVDLTGLGLEQDDTFTITATVTITDSNNVTRTEDVTFTVNIPDPDDNIRNTRYAATAIGGGDGTLVAGTSSTSFLKASLIDANGNEISDPTQQGFLKITSTNSAYRIAIDQLDSNDGGDATTVNPLLTATNRGFSHFFGLNNFFDFNQELGNASYNLKVRDDIITDPSLLSGGKIKRSVSTGSDSVYSYEIGAGSNDSILELLGTQDANLKFAATGSLPELTTTANSYAIEIYNYSAVEANDAKAEVEKSNILQSALMTKSDDISGINLDEELAKTIEIQNAYNAAAKTLSIVREMFRKIEEVLT
jgi:flagellar hook-associated protein 1